jgi:hypothetical protein
MNKLIKRLKKKSFSGNEVLELCDDKAVIITYPELADYDSIDDVMKPYGAVILLYETAKNYGHWCCLIKTKKNRIEFFDPYGLSVDKELKFIPQHFRKSNDEEYPHLSYLLYKSKYEVEYNHTKLQKFMKDVNTCGRWVAMRIIMRYLPLPKFVDLFKNNKCFNSDSLVTLMTSFV